MGQGEDGQKVVTHERIVRSTCARIKTVHYIDKVIPKEPSRSTVKAVLFLCLGLSDIQMIQLKIWAMKEHLMDTPPYRMVIDFDEETNKDKLKTFPVNCLLYKKIL